MIPTGAKVYVAPRPVDFRKGPDGLAALVRDTGADPFSGALYVFRAKRADRVKIVWWDGSGLCLFAKRLDEDKFRWPRVENGVIRLAAPQLMALVEGMDWTRVRAERRHLPDRPWRSDSGGTKAVSEAGRICFCWPMTNSVSALPDDVDTLKTMLVAMASEKDELQTETGQLRGETAELKAEIVRMATLNERAEERIANLHVIIKQLERARFGRSSEKLDADQQAFAFDEVQTGLGAIEAELEAARSTGERRRASRPRKAFPAHLERVEIIVEPETVACACGACQPVRIGEDVSERLDVTPAKFRVIVTRRPKYGCVQCKEGVSQAPAPGHLVEAGVPSEAPLAHVAVSKYADGLPLYRQEGIYARDGVEISRNSMANWMGHVGFHLAPLAVSWR